MRWWPLDRYAVCATLPLLWWRVTASPRTQHDSLPLLGAATSQGERAFVYPPLRDDSDMNTGSGGARGDSRGSGEEGERRRAIAARRRAMGRRLSTRRTDLLAAQVESHNSFLSTVARVSDPASGNATRKRHTDEYVGGSSARGVFLWACVVPMHPRGCARASRHHGRLTRVCTCELWPWRRHHSHHTALFYRATGASSVTSPVRHPDAPFFFANAAQAAGGLVGAPRPRWSDSDSMYGGAMSVGGSASVVSDGFVSTGSWSGGDSSAVATAAAADGYLPTGNWYMGPHLKARARHRLAKHMLQRALAGVAPHSARSGAATGRSSASGASGALSSRGYRSARGAGGGVRDARVTARGAGASSDAAGAVTRSRQARRSYPVDATSTNHW